MLFLARCEGGPWPESHQEEGRQEGGGGAGQQLEEQQEERAGHAAGQMGTGWGVCCS